MKIDQLEERAYVWARRRGASRMRARVIRGVVGLSAVVVALVVGAAVAVGFLLAVAWVVAGH